MHRKRFVLQRPRRPAPFSGPPRRAETAARDSGWTFVETLVVIAIVLILSGTVGSIAVVYLAQAREAAARSQIETFTLALNAYLFDNGSYPTQTQGLEALWRRPDEDPVPACWRGPYLQRPVPADPWGRRYEYTVPGPDGLPFGIRSFGSDGIEGGDGNQKDISSWSP